jgi:hypothetical protein
MLSNSKMIIMSDHNSSKRLRKKWRVKRFFRKNFCE